MKQAVLFMVLLLGGVSAWGQPGGKPPPKVLLKKLFSDVPETYSAQKPYIIHRDSRLSDARWRFGAGDSLGWEKPAYTDAHWTGRVAPQEPIRANNALWATGTGWYRLRVKLSNRTARQPISLVIKQFGRTDIYLDGRLLRSIRPPRIDSGGSQRAAAFVPLPLADTLIHLLAVRYSFRPEPVFFAETGEPAFHAAVAPSAGLDFSHQLSEAFGVGLDFVMVGIFGILSLLHLLFFRANRLQRINRTLTWAMLAFALTFLADYLTDVTPTLTLDSVVELTGKLAFRAACVLLLWSVYQYLRKPPGWLFFSVLALFTVDLAYRGLVGTPPPYTGNLAVGLGFIDYVRLSWIGRKRKDPDSRLPWKSLKTGLSSLGTILVLIVIGAILSSQGYRFGLNIDMVLVPVAALIFVAILSIPVGLSLSLVQEYGRTYRALNTKLQEVEQLSARTVAQEQEKQALLARQNETLEQQVRERTAALDQSLADLRATQNQLIQREKLASLGELTAGVAHEIQNPLNFVTNFSDVSVELISELENEQARLPAERDATLESELLADIKQNITKITQHGQRAAAIVRNMLQHSRNSTGQREPTNLNALTDEYLRLAYHGFRQGAGPNALNVRLITQFADNLPLVPVVQQDMGRVLMNLFTNALYAVQQRAQTPPDTYLPTLTVATTRRGNRVEIRVQDNGTGIPPAVIDKIFQPFFTTKPTGEGTGLGLSLSYDIITKGHGGTLTVTSEAGAGAVFVVSLPV